MKMFALIMSLSVAPCYGQTQTLPYITGGKQYLCDVYNPQIGSAPYPAAIFFHGGGFRRNDRTASPNVRQALVDAGLAVVSCDYPLNDAGGPGSGQFPAPYIAGQRAVQQMRYYARSGRLPIRSDRIVVAGGSAGASIAQYVGYAPDRKNIAASDPVAQESSRVSGVIALEAQTTYTPTELTEIFGPVTMPEWLPWFLGVQTVAEILDPVKQISFATASPTYWRSTDDPPAFYGYVPTDPTDFIHNVGMAKKLLTPAAKNDVTVSAGSSVLRDMQEFANRVTGATP
jgi:acetyl esterase/lipase